SRLAFAVRPCDEPAECLDGRWRRRHVGGDDGIGEQLEQRGRIAIVELADAHEVSGERVDARHPLGVHWRSADVATAGPTRAARPGGQSQAVPAAPRSHSYDNRTTRAPV